MSAAGLVWVATAMLAKKTPVRSGFSHDEIQHKVYELKPHHGFTDATTRAHITTHCVADKKPAPWRRKVYRSGERTGTALQFPEECDLAVHPPGRGEPYESCLLISLPSTSPPSRGRTWMWHRFRKQRRTTSPRFERPIAPADAIQLACAA